MSKNSLIYGRAIFTLIVIVAFGLIIVNEKGGKMFLPKATNKINNYINENYSQIKEDISIEKIDYKNRIFTAKVTSKKNKHLSFNITYKNKSIKDTYKKDYIEGNSLLTYLNKKNEEEILKKTNTNYKSHAITTLDKYTNNVKDEIINEKNLLSLKYYYLEKEITTDFKVENIINEISKNIELNTKNNITPKYYKFILINKTDTTNVIEIKNITEEFINNNKKEQIIKDIISKNDSQILKDNKIKYKYLNEEE